MKITPTDAMPSFRAAVHVKALTVKIKRCSTTHIPCLTEDQQNPIVRVIRFELVVRATVLSPELVSHRVRKPVCARPLGAEQLVSHDRFTVAPQKLLVSGGIGTSSLHA